LLVPLVAALALASVPAPPSDATLAGGATAHDADAWYGGPAVVADLASGGALALAFGLESKGMNWPAGAALAVALGGLGFGAPVNHVANGHLGRAWGSLSMRLGGVVAGVIAAGITSAVTHCQVIGGEENPNGTCSGAALGVAFALPVLATFALDDALLARGPAPPELAPTPRTPAGRVLLGNSLISGGVIVVLGSGILLIAESQQVADSQRSVAGGGGPGAQLNLDKAYLGLGIGIGLLAAGAAGIAAGAYLVNTAPGRSTAGIAPWTDGLGARGLALAARF
jgi:hypothetical protein